MATTKASGSTFHVQRFGEAKEIDDNEENELLKKLKNKISSRIGRAEPATTDDAQSSEPTKEEKIDA